MAGVALPSQRTEVASWASYAGELTVDVGGYINVDGRLAAYGH
jgi:hypothetical protein